MPTRLQRAGPRSCQRLAAIGLTCWGLRTAARAATASPCRIAIAQPLRCLSPEPQRFLGNLPPNCVTTTQRQSLRRARGPDSAVSTTQAAAKLRPRALEKLPVGAQQPRTSVYAQPSGKLGNSSVIYPKIKRLATPEASSRFFARPMARSGVSHRVRPNTLPQQFRGYSEP